VIFRRTFAISLFALLPLSAGCGSSGDIGWNFRPPSGVTSHTSNKFRDTPIKRIAVLPFRNESGVENAGVKLANFFYEGLAPSSRYEVQPPPVVPDIGDVQIEFRLRGAQPRRGRNQVNDTSWLVEKVNRFISIVQPYITNLKMTYPGEYFEGSAEPAAPETIQGTVAKSSGGTTDDRPLDAILTGVVTKYRNRSGGALIGDQGSHVTYTAYLVSTKNGDILWEATFNEEQIFLMDNLLLLPRYAEHGLIWQKNDQLARSGLKRVLATFPGLLENIGKTP